MGSDRLHLLHCEERLRRIQKYTEEGRAAFMGSRVTQDAILWNLQMVSVTARSISEEEKGKRPHIDWAGLGSLCDGLLDVELTEKPDRVWRMVEEVVPVFQRRLRLVLTSKI